MTDGPAAAPLDELTQAGVGHTLWLELDGFDGPLDQLLALARAHEIDLARLSLPALCDQLGAALGRDVPLGRKADWIVMAAWLLQLRSRLLLPAETPLHQAAQAEAGQLRDRLAGLRVVQALATWLDARAQLGRDVFARGRPELLGLFRPIEHEVDVIDFLWASMALFDDDLPEPGTVSRYRPHWLDLHSLPDARLRILRLLGESPDGRSLDQLLPEQGGEAEDRTETMLKRRSAWTSTFVASLELAKQGKASLQQEQGFAPIRVQQGAGAALPADGWT